MKEATHGYELNQLMTNAMAMADELDRRKVPPEDDTIQQIVDDKILRMANIEQVRFYL